MVVGLRRGRRIFVGRVSCHCDDVEDTSYGDVMLNLSILMCIDVLDVVDNKKNNSAEKPFVFTRVRSKILQRR